jgi:exopolysaccharide biosynthesis polyprenyl glycosylphosphotransferase
MRNNASIIYNVCLLIGDALAITVAFTVAYILRVSVSHVTLSAHVRASTYILTLVSLLPFWLLIFGLLGLYSYRVHENRFSEFGRLLTGSFVGILFVISYSYVANVSIFPARLVTLYGFLFAFFVTLLFRTIARAIRRELFMYGVSVNNVLIVGDTQSTINLIEALAKTEITGYKVIGVVGGVKHNFSDKPLFKLFKSFGTAIEHLESRQIHTIIQTELYAQTELNDAVLTYAQENHIAYRFVPGNSELFTGKIEADLFYGQPVIAVHQTALIGWGRVVKRLFDIIGSLLLLIPALPIMAIICIIMLFDHGDPIFRQTRLSRFGNKVSIYKFRTQLHAYHRMTPEQGFAKMNRPDLSAQFRANGDFLEDDPRISKLGRFLRTTSLDELPQLFNVLKGDISLVGPRPLEPFELEKYGKKSLLLSVRTGLTGLAVISGRRDIPFEERRTLDIYYVQNWSFWGDLVILARTASVVIFHRGAR